MNDTPDPVPSEAAGDEERFPSISSLRAAHGRLLKRQFDDGETEELLDDAEAFIRRGRATGALLDADDDRWASQGLLDYWTAVLYRAGRDEPPDATLDGFDPKLAPDLKGVSCPYLGLDAFGEDNHQVFFGRQRFIDKLVSWLRGWLKEKRLLTVIGPSGCGKSSLVSAGFLPALKGGAVPGSEDWHYYPPMVPGSNPLVNLASTLLPANADTPKSTQDLTTRFQEDPNHLSHLIDEADSEPSVLVIDQFEEIFTLCDDAGVRKAFTDSLLGLVQAPGARHLVILTMRVDYEPRVSALPEFEKLMSQAVMRITPLSAAELREAIVKPAESVGLKFEEGVVDALIEDILGEPAALPLLQFTLLKLWETRERNRVTWDAYGRLGGGRQALANSADEFYRGLIPEEQEAAKYILLSMVRPTHGLEVTSSRIRLRTLYEAGPAQDRVERVLNKLVEARLVRLTRGDTPDDHQVEVAHEALVRNWPRLVNWLEEERGTMTVRRRLEIKAAEWVRQGQGSISLLDSGELPEAERWLESADAKRLGPGRHVPELVQASQKAAARSRNTRALALTLVGMLLLMAAVIAFWQRNVAQTQQQLAEVRAETAVAAESTIQAAAGELSKEVDERRDAEVTAVKARNTAVAAREEADLQRDKAVKQRITSDSLRLAAQARLVSDPQLRLLLSLEALSVTHTLQAEDALRQAIKGARVRHILSSHKQSVNALAVSDNGRWLATAGNDGTVRLWETDTGRELAALNTDGEATLVALSPDGRWLAATNRKGKVTVWDTSTPAEEFPEPATLSHSSEVLAIAFSPDEARLATASRDGSARLWSLSTRREIHSLDRVPVEISALVLSHDGEQLATAEFHGVVLLRNMLTGEGVTIDEGRGSAVTVMAFSPDGRLLATGGADGTARVWNTDDGSKKATLRGHVGGITTLAFHRYGQQLVTGGEDRTAQLWSLDDPDAGPKILFGHGDRVNAVAFQPDGSALATASADGTVRLWDRHTGEEEATLEGHSSSVNALAFSPPGRGWLASVSSDGTARIWAASGSEAEILLRGHQDTVIAVSFSPDGKLLATGGADGTLRLWSGSTALGAGGSDVQDTILDESLGVVVDAEFSPDGTLLAVCSFSEDTESGRISLWSIPTDPDPEPVALRRLAGWMAFGVAFSPDGAVLATSDVGLEEESSMVRIWDFAGGIDEEMAVLPVPQILVYDVAFSHDGNLLAASGQQIRESGSSVHLWDLAPLFEAGEAPADPVVMRGNGNSFFFSFSPTEQIIASGYDEGMVRIWDAAQALEVGPSNAEVAVLDHGYAGEIPSVAFSADGHLLATGDDSGAIRIWEVAGALDTGGSGAQYTPVGEQEGTIYRLAFSPDGHWLAAGDAEGAVRLWPLDVSELREIACDRAIRNLSQTEWERYKGLDVPYRPTCPNLPVHMSAVEHYIRMGEVDTALDALRQAVTLDRPLQLNPEEEVARLLVLRGQELAHGAAYQEALSYYRRAGELNPAPDWDPEDELAHVLVEVGIHAVYRLSFDKALAALTQAVELAPALKTDAAKQVLEGAEYYLGRQYYLGECEKPLALLRQVGEWEPELGTGAAKLLADLGERCAGEGDYDGALAAFRQALAFDPTLALVPEARIALAQGREHVLQGEIEAGLSLFRQALELDATLELNPEEEVGWLLIEDGVDAMREGSFDQALAALARAVELEPTLKTNAAKELLGGAKAYIGAYGCGGGLDEALGLLNQAVEWEPELSIYAADLLADLGDRCAGEANYDGALAAFRQALEFDPTLALVPEARVALAQGREHIRQGQIDAGLSLFRQALELDATLELDPEEEVARLLVKVAAEHTYANEYHEALATARQAVEFDPTIETREPDYFAWLYNDVCWWGSLDGQAEEVLPACERAVELVPGDGNYVDSRGLARALTGDYPGAIEDFRFFIEWAEQTGHFQYLVPKRKAWIAELEAGRNPFDEATLEDLRYE